MYNLIFDAAQSRYSTALRSSIIIPEVEIYTFYKNVDGYKKVHDAWFKSILSYILLLLVN